MTLLSEQELKLQRKFRERAELRKKKELKKQQEEAAEAAAKAKSSAEPGLSAIDKAKAVLKKKAAASQAPSQKPDSAQASAKQQADPKTAAKRAREETEQKPASAAIKRPTLKRPTIQRTVPKPSPKADDVDNSPDSTHTSQSLPVNGRPTKRQHTDDEAFQANRAPINTARDNAEDEHIHKRPRHERDDQAPTANHSNEGSTLFVGDLPPYYNNEEVYSIFSQFGEIDEIRVMGKQCYAFLTFRDPSTAQGLVRHFASQPMIASGHELRISMAHGTLPDWKRGNGGGRSDRNAAHPRVAQAQLHGDALAEQLLAAGAHGLNFNAKPAEREMVTYDDL